MSSERKRKRQKKSAAAAARTHKGAMNAFPDEVFDLVKEAVMVKNQNKRGAPWYISNPIAYEGDEVPPELKDEECWHPRGSSRINIVHEGKTYQGALHRFLMLIAERDAGRALPGSHLQASHLCMDKINLDGKGAKHCINPAHLIPEDDLTNKLRQRCAGWVYIRDYKGHKGGYWYPACTHTPACLRYTPSTTKPTLLVKDIAENGDGEQKKQALDLLQENGQERKARVAAANANEGEPRSVNAQDLVEAEPLDTDAEEADSEELVQSLEY